MNQIHHSAFPLRRLVLGLGCALTLSLPACSTFRVSEMSNTGDLRRHTETRHSLFWGILEEPIELHPNHKNDKYRSNASGLHRVEVRTNYLYSLASVVTLGIWTPVDVSWECLPAKMDLDLER